MLSAEPGGTIVIGQRARTREEFAQMVEEGRWGELLNEIPVHAGDFFQIDAGTVHAIKGGTVILETQQSSDITYASTTTTAPRPTTAFASSTSPKRSTSSITTGRCPPLVRLPRRTGLSARWRQTIATRSSAWTCRVRSPCPSAIPSPV